MPSISSAIVGVEVGPFSQPVDARWLMAYAAGLGETDPRYYDTRTPDGPVAHPLFPVCYEWPVALAIRAKTIDAALGPRSVHATHHLIVHRPPRAGDTLLTAATVVAVARRRSGVLVVTRMTTTDERGAPVSTTEYGSIYRGVECDAEATLPAASVGAWTTRRPARAEHPPGGRPTAAAGAEPAWTETVGVSAGAAHVYTECARIWNPIHTDIAVAQAAGLPDVILHGTATLALAVSRAVARERGADATRVREIAGRFTGMVRMPSSFVVRGRRQADGVVFFDAVTADGAPVLSDGSVKA
jgi:acyl dehydratase